MGSATVNTVPAPSAGSSCTVPPCSAAISRTNAKPSPAPPISRLLDLSTRKNGSKTIFGRKGWCITAVVTLFSASIAYFISGKALEPLKELAQQAEKVDQDNLVDVRLEENTVAEFRQLSQSVNQMLDRLAHSFDLQRQFAGNAAHELKTPLAIMQAKLEIFAEDHMNTDAETAELVHFQTEQIARLSALVRTLLEMSNLQAVPRDDCIELAPLADEIVTNLTPLAQKKPVKRQSNTARCRYRLRYSR